MKDRLVVSDWLIGSAVRFEYGDNGKSNLYLIKIKSKFFSVVEKYKSVLSDATNDQQNVNSSNQNENPLEKVDCR
jgi:hypothetical protein